MVTSARCWSGHRHGTQWSIMMLVCWLRLWSTSQQELRAWSQPLLPSSRSLAQRTVTRPRRSISLGATASGASVEMAGAREELPLADMELTEDLVPDEDVGFVAWLLGELSFDVADLALAFAAAVVAGVAIAFATAQDEPLQSEEGTEDASPGEGADGTGAKVEKKSATEADTAANGNKYK
mmetsp:Transcript_21454/g.49120  ORF Transcript_21454/g.49120 Transcript_21454/m.49120 type:complete len:181 (-) Transcript_21454:14-556(-)